MIKPDLFKPAFVIVAVLLFFYTYYYLAHSGLLKKAVEAIGYTSWFNLRLFISQKLLGFLFLGILPGILYFALIDTDIGKFGFSIREVVSNAKILLFIVPVILLLVYINQKLNPDNNSFQMPYKNWNFLLFAFNAVGWIIYLIAYEFLFRGVLLSECETYFGFWPAIAINISIYSAIHMVNGRDQAIGALFFGAFACYFTLTRETLVIPVIMHIVLSLGSDFFSLQMNKRLVYVSYKPFSLPGK